MTEEKPRVYSKEYLNIKDPNDYGFDDELWDFEKFKRKYRITIVSYKGMDMEFDIVGVHPALVNAFRRIMLSEIPTMAIEKVYIYNNTSIIQDEVLAHRLGLIPLKADARLFEYRSEESEEGTENDTLEFDLKYKYTRKGKDGHKDSQTDNYIKNISVYSNQIKWLPKGRQASMYKEADIGPIHEDILIARMRPGHELDLKLVAVKGIGQDHAKFSPVATAYYRLLPEIKLNREVAGVDARLLKQCFSPGVIEIDDQQRAYVKNARYDSNSRNVFRYPHLSDSVTMSRVQNHFIFNIESVGSLKPDEIFIEAVKVLKRKCRLFLDEISDDK
ncbi:DNA-directed RNA polymerases I and III subunit RPAC1 [Sergentomyia squamirostris]